MSDRQLKAFNTSIFDRVLEHGSLKEKLHLADQLSTLACDEKAPGLERSAIIPTLLELTGDPVKQVREALAKKLAKCTTLHPDLLFSIVADDADISLAFIAETKSMDHRRCLTILRVGDTARQMVMVGRNDLSTEAIGYVIENCDSDICSALLDNEAVELNNDNYRKLYLRFRDVGEITERLLARNDLPLEVRILQAKRASQNVQKLMADRGWIQTDDAENIIADSQEKTLLKILANAPASELSALVAFLSSKNLLTSSIILRAACRGHIQVVSKTLAYLSSIAETKVDKIISERAMMGLKSVYGKAGLPKNCFHIVRASIDVAADLKEMPNRAAQIRFGPQIIECLMTRYNSISAKDKSVCLEIVARLSDENTRNLARRLAGQLQQAA